MYLHTLFIIGYAITNIAMYHIDIKQEYFLHQAYYMNYIKILYYNYFFIKKYNIIRRSC